MTDFGNDYPYNNLGQQRRFSIAKTTPASQQKERKISSNRVDPALPNNSISTSKYTALTFLPKNLFEQYSEIANIYFFLLGVLQLIHEVSNSEGLPTIWAPLFMINLATAAKKLYEDLKRKKSDQEENNSKTRVITERGLEETTWAKVQVGCIVKVMKNEFFPADGLLLSTSEPKGVCYIETKNLDGETNLKQKNVPKEVYQYYPPSEDYKQFERKRLIFEFEPPNAYLYKFNGLVKFSDSSKASISDSNFILRGCSLKNTKWCYILIAYTGHDTKIMMNSFNSRPKQSHLEKEMNKQIMIIFALMCLSCFFCGLYYIISFNDVQEDFDYLEHEDSDLGVAFVVIFFSWILNLSNFVPISLLVTLEVVKMIQGIMISKDRRMTSGQTPTQVQSSNLNEELGQIEYIFSDKTGTLTCNIMEFKKLSVNGLSYGETLKGQPNYMEDISAFPVVSNVNFRDKDFIDVLRNKSHPEYPHVRNNLFLLALCHTIITEHQDGDLSYNASSPDELALINMCRFCGVKYLGKDEMNVMKVEFDNHVYDYELIYVLEFNSTRKRMSVVLKDLARNNILLYTKGADSIILERLNKQRSTKISETIKNLSEYGKIGLRTLLTAEKVLSTDEFNEWNAKYVSACQALENRDEKMCELQEVLEVDLTLVGATAIEDRLQDEVGDTIDNLMRAGIKVWVLTGDKIETAINIGFSCKLIKSDMEQYIVDEKEESKLVASLESVQTKMLQQTNPNCAFIISGDALVHGLQLPKLIMSVASKASAVVCCRVSPKQKQEVVSLVRKERPTVATLAIGDGANDVNMITAAHVGVGIKGLEGAQAARASDYAVGEFKLLRRLLFTHGRDSYRKNSNLILYNFYKNSLLVLPQFWFGTLNFFSGPTFYDNFTYQFFNVFFASMPIMIYSILDTQYDYEILHENQLNYYQQGLKYELFNTKVFWFWMATAIYQSVIMTFFSYYILESSFVNEEGQTLSFFVSGAMVFGLVVVVSNIKVFLISYEHSIGTVFFNLGSQVFYMVCLIAITHIDYRGGQIFLELKTIMSSASFHLGNILILGLTSLVDLGVTFVIRWKEEAQLKEQYFLKIEEELQRRDDDIIFLPNFGKHSEKNPLL